MTVFITDQEKKVFMSTSDATIFAADRLITNRFNELDTIDRYLLYRIELFIGNKKVSQHYFIP